MDVRKKYILKIKFPHPPGAGGPGSFQIRFENELKVKGHKVYYKNDNAIPDIIMVVGGTRSLFWLWKMKRQGVPIIYRLDGIGWLHKKKNVSLKYYLTAEIRNALSKTIHGVLASKIIYQSQFVKNWWDKEGWCKRQQTSIIHNGVAIPDEKEIIKALSQRTTKRLVILEGVVDYTPYAVRLLNDFAIYLPKDIQIEVYGKFEQKSEQDKLDSRIHYNGFLERKDVYKVLKGSVYLSLDIHPACPNTVAEALACAAPVVAYNTGALPELVDDTCGIIVPYGSDPWELDYPNNVALQAAIVNVFESYDTYAKNAYKKAVDNYSLEDMFSKYFNQFKKL